MHCAIGNVTLAVQYLSTEFSMKYYHDEYNRMKLLGKGKLRQ